MLQVFGSSAGGVGLQSFSTNFPATEDPISQGGIWTNGLSPGLDWSDCQTTPGLAFGTQSIHTAPPFDDSIACLSGYHPNQYAQGTIARTTANFMEVELHLRRSISAHLSAGYEIDITTNFGLSIVVWLGALNAFTVLVNSLTGPNITMNNGDVWYAQMVGTVIIVKCNGVIVKTYDTSGDAFQVGTGGPGMGFYRDGGGTPTANNTMGFSNFSCGEL